MLITECFFDFLLFRPYRKDPRQQRKADQSVADHATGVSSVILKGSPQLLR